jgi:PAS domain S-box-containing protein
VAALDPILAVALASTLIQFGAAALALRLIPLTNARLAWSMISGALILQGVRRALNYACAAHGAPLWWTPGADEVAGLVISLLLLAGVAGIGPLFLAMRKSERRLRTVADFTYDMEYWRLPDGRMEYVSPASERVCGRRPEEFLVKSDLMLDMVHPDDTDMVREHMRRDDERCEKHGTLEFRITMPDGSVRWLSHDCRPVFDEDGTYLGRRGTNRDITDRKKAEESRSDVERIMRHDLKSPLLGIIGIPEALKDDPGIPEHARHMLSLVERAGRDLLDLVESSLALAKLERGVPLEKKDPVDLAELARAIFTGLGKQAAGYGVRFALFLDGRPAAGEAGLVVPGARLLLRTMLANLLKNAMEASSNGDEVRVDLCRDKDAVRIEVRNTGLVPEEVRETLFEKYASAGKPGGTGLGTYSARLAARAHGGDVTFTSAPGRGTVFTVFLPGANGAEPIQRS